MEAWESAYHDYRQYISQSLSTVADVVVISPDNDDLPAEECTGPIVIGSYERTDSVACVHTQGNC